jgi:Tfp pilus assembly protein FimT
MMVALAIGAVVAAGLAGLSRAISPRVELRATAERVAGDFERARMEARRTGAEVTVAMDTDGYRIQALDLAGDWGEASARVAGRPIGSRTVSLSPAPFGTDPIEIALVQDGLSATVRTGAATGRAEARLDP